MSLANRDLFLLASAIGSPDSLKMAALVYDALVERLGQPGVGYDPAELFRAYQEEFPGPWKQFKEAEKRGVEALKAEGWI